MSGWITRRFCAADEAELSRFFASVADDKTAMHYRPHAFTDEQATIIANHAGRDSYYGIWVGGHLRGYGMLRGLDAGYPMPSLGIYVAPSERGTGASSALMRALHVGAREAGAARVRLRVLPDNMPARRLYEHCGYLFDGTIDRGELVGIKTLTAGSSSAR